MSINKRKLELELTYQGTYKNPYNSKYKVINLKDSDGEMYWLNVEDGSKFLNLTGRVGEKVKLNYEIIDRTLNYL